MSPRALSTWPDRRRQAALLQVVRVHRQQRLVVEVEQPRDAAGAAHAVPLVTQTAGEQADRARWRRCFGSRLVLDLDETRTPAGREDAVFVQALAPWLAPSG
jgi:hypothetical protein